MADESEPEVLFTCNQHAREHLTVEMALYLIGELTSRYATDPIMGGTGMNVNFVRVLRAEA